MTVQFNMTVKLIHCNTVSESKCISETKLSLKFMHASDSSFTVTYVTYLYI